MDKKVQKIHIATSRIRIELTTGIEMLTTPNSIVTHKMRKYNKKASSLGTRQ